MAAEPLRPLQNKNIAATNFVVVVFECGVFRLPCSAGRQADWRQLYLQVG